MDKKIRRHDNIIPTNIRETISSRYKRITKAINREFWGIESETDNSIYVGSYGRGTAISTSDIDILVSLPIETLDNFNNLSGNSQSRLLQAVRSAIKTTYPISEIRADGQVIKINFRDGIMFEVLPAFKQNDGTYIYADTNMGGNWMSTNPKVEQEAIREKNNSSNGLLVSTCKHLRYIRDNHFSSYKLSGIVIDSFVYNAIENWHFIRPGENPSKLKTFEEHLLYYFEKFILNNYYSVLKAPGSKDKIDLEESKLCLEKILRYMAG